MANVALLQGKKVLVTGAARGLGRDFAQAIAEAGAQVVMADILDDLVQEEAIELQQRGLKVKAVKIDLADALVKHHDLASAAILDIDADRAASVEQAVSATKALKNFLETEVAKGLKVSIQFSSSDGD